MEAIFLFLHTDRKHFLGLVIFKSHLHGVACLDNGKFLKNKFF